MKLSFRLKNKEANIDMDVERIIEKGMNQHAEKGLYNFKEKQSEKRKLLDLKHKQKMEIEQERQKRKNWFERREEARIKKKQLELELEKKQRKEDLKQALVGIVLMTFFIIIMLIICELGDKGILG